jgi:hypothetical protein
MSVFPALTIEPNKQRVMEMALEWSSEMKHVTGASPNPANLLEVFAAIETMLYPCQHASESQTPSHTQPADKP